MIADAKNAGAGCAISHLAGMALVVAVTVAVYANGSHAPFAFDDHHNISENHRIRIRRLGLNELLHAAFKSPTSLRPVANASFALNYYFGKYDVVGYHIVNIAIHAINGILVYILVFVTIRSSERSIRSAGTFRRGSANWIALFTSLWFAVHPVQTQTVTYVVQRMNSMAVMFYLLCIILYVAGRHTRAKGRRWTIWAAGVACWAAALGSKEIAVTLPPVILLYEWFFLADVNGKRVVRRCGVVLAAAAILALPAVVLLNAHVVDFSLRDFSMGQRVLTQFRVVVFYASVLLFPHPDRLNLIHHIATSQSIMEPLATTAAMVLILGLFVLALSLARTQRLISFCIFWFLIHLLLESSILPLEMVFEHRLYLPMLGASGLCVTLLSRAAAGHRHWATFAAVTATLALAAAANHRNHDWGDPVILWSDVISKTPRSDRAHTNIGVTFIERGQPERAIVELRQAVTLKPHSEIAHNNLGNALLTRGQLVDAAVHLAEAIRIKPDYASALTNLGNLSRTRGDVDEAIRHYGRSLEIDPDLAQTHSNLGIALRSKGKIDEAIKHYLRALVINPDYDDAHYNLGNALQSQGKLDEAIRHYHQVLRLRPDYSEAHNNLGAALLTQGHVVEAIDCFRDALALDGDDAEAHTNLGHALQMEGELEESADQFRKAIALQPDKVIAHRSLAALYRNRGQVDRAVHHYSRAVAIDPENADAQFNLALTLHLSGQTQGAVRHYRQALQLDPHWPKPLTHLAWILATDPNDRLRHPQEAIDLARRASLLLNDRDAAALDTLAAAYASAGQFDDAVTASRKALDLAEAAGDGHLKKGILERRTLYERKKPFRDRLPEAGHGKPSP